MEIIELHCHHCGEDYEAEHGYDDTYCSEECWETATDYGGDLDEDPYDE